MNLGNSLFQARKKRGLSQEDVAEKLGVEVQFVVIDWDNKIMELNSKNIDVVWNGMTLTDEVTSSMNCTNAYCKNAQVVITAAQ